MLHVVGWEQSYNPADAIAERLTETESGLYFQGAHPLVTLDNMAAIVPDNWGYQYPVWNDTKEWQAGTVVQYANDSAGNKKYWRALVNNVAEVPRRGFDVLGTLQYLIGLFGAFDPQRNFHGGTNVYPN